MTRIKKASWSSAAGKSSVPDEDRLEVTGKERRRHLEERVAVACAVDDGILKQHFAIPHCYVLFVTASATRRDNMVQLGQERVGSRNVAETISHYKAEKAVSGLL